MDKRMSLHVQEIQSLNRKNPEADAFVVEKGVSYPVQTNGDYAKHIYREHNQESDQMAHWGAEGVSKVNVETVENTKTLESDTRVLVQQHQQKLEKWMRRRDKSSIQRKLTYSQ